MDPESQCPICFDPIEIDGSTVISCGHMYHFVCLQKIYSHDHEHGKRSECSLCRQAIKSPPIRIFGAGGFPKEPISYKIEKDALRPNTDGKRRQNQSAVVDHPPANDARIEFYENRLADLEAMLEGYEGIDEQVDELEADLEETQSLLERTRRELDSRNLEMAAMTAKQVESEKKIKRLEMEIGAAKKELEDFKYTKASAEVERLANQISHLQSDSYYKFLSKDPEIGKEEVILMLAGMTTEFQKMKSEREQLERELRIFRIYKEKIEKQERERKATERNNRHSNTHVKENNNIVIDADDNAETDLESEAEKHITNSPINPFRIVSKPTTSAMMVPKTIPKTLKLSGPSASTGTGKKSKIIDMPDGKKFFL